MYRCCFACMIFQVTVVPSVGQDSSRTCRLIWGPEHFTCFLYFLWSRYQVVEHQACWRKYSDFTNFFSDAPLTVMYYYFAYLEKLSGLNLSSWDTPCVVSRRRDSSYSSMERIFPVKGTDIVVHVICCILHKLAVELWYINFPRIPLCFD